MSPARNKDLTSQFATIDNKLKVYTTQELDQASYLDYPLKDLIVGSPIADAAYRQEHSRPSELTLAKIGQNQVSINIPPVKNQGFDTIKLTTVLDHTTPKIQSITPKLKSIIKPNGMFHKSQNSADIDTFARAESRQFSIMNHSREANKIDKALKTKEASRESLDKRHKDFPSMNKSALKEVQGHRKVMIQLEANQVDNGKFKDNQSSIQSKLNRNIKPSGSQKP